MEEQHARAIVKAAERGDLEQVRRLMEQNRMLLNAAWNGRSPLTEALAWNGRGPPFGGKAVRRTTQPARRRHR